MEKSILNSKLKEIKLSLRLKKLKKETGMIVQSLLFPKNKFSEKTAKNWARVEGYKLNKIDITDDFIHLTQKSPKRFNTYKTIKMGDGVKARIAGNMHSKFSSHISLKGFSKFSDIKSDLDMKMPMDMELRILCEGKNRDGNIQREDLEASLGGWEGLPIIDFHNMADMKNPTDHKLSDRVGYTLNNPRMKLIDGKWWIIVPAEIINRNFAYQLYLRNKRNKPLEASAEYGWQKYWLNGELYQTNLEPHIISIVDRGHIEGNKLSLAS